MPPADKRKSIRLFAALCVVCATATAGYILQTGGDAADVSGERLPAIATSPMLDLAPEPPAAPGTSDPVTVAAVPEKTDTERLSVPARAAVPAAAAAASAPLFLVRHTGIDRSYGRLAAEFGRGAAATRQETPLNCERVHFAAGRGVCLDARRGAITTYAAILFDARFQPTATLPLSGIPSRTRVSPDGRYAAFTVFISGHSYGATGFSTETQIVESVTGAPVVANLEQMEVWSNGSRWQEADFNFWGVTFAHDPNRFYATLGTGGRAYLVQGDIAANRLTVVREGVECPSLSPDNTRLAFKKRVPGSGLAKWRIAVLDLATLTESLVAEERYVDEQLEWLDDGHILYTQAAEAATSRAVTDVWVIPSDGSGEPALLLHAAASPTPVRSANRTTE